MNLHAYAPAGSPLALIWTAPEALPQITAIALARRPSRRGDAMFWQVFTKRPPLRIDCPVEMDYLKVMRLRIKQIRKARGITQEALAEASGVTQATISRLERNIANGSITGLERIAAVLCVSMIDLFEPEAAEDSVLATADAIASLSEPDRAAVLAVVRSLQRRHAYSPS